MEVDGNLRQQLLIPAGHEDNVLVTVPLEQLPDEVEEIIEVLGAELAPISVWLDVAKAYLQRGQVDQYLVLLRCGAACAEFSKLVHWPVHSGLR